LDFNPKSDFHPKSDFGFWILSARIQHLNCKPKNVIAALGYSDLVVQSIESLSEKYRIVFSVFLEILLISQCKINASTAL